MGRWPFLYPNQMRFTVKRKILLILLATGLAATVFAQGWGNGRRHPQTPNPQPRNWQRPVAEKVTVTGTLIVARGLPALKSGDVTYVVGGIHRLTGFVDGLKEGAQVTVEGLALSRLKDNSIKFLRPAKLTLNGKTYDMGVPGDALRKFNFNRQSPHGRQRPNFL